MACRVSAAEFAMLKGNLTRQTGSLIPSPARSAAPRKAKSALPENIVEAQIVGFLRLRRWIVKRQHVGKHVPLGFLLRMLERGRITKADVFRAVVDVGEKHAADWRAERSAGGGLMQVLYVEVKAPGRKPSPEQADWIERVRLTGALATWSDSIDDFESWYRAEVKDLR